MTARIWTALAIAAALIAFGGWISRGYWKPALDRAVAAAFNAQDDADARGREADQAVITSAETTARFEQRQAARDATHQLEQQTREDPDAQTPLDLDRLGRLRGHDDQLCRLRPEVCGDTG